jgi:uncharacterized membrane protein YciS (DUF1049 family)
MNNDLTLTHIIGIVIVVTIFSICILLLSSSLTIISINTLFADEIIALKWQTVFALAWIKFWLGLMFGNSIKIKRD